MSKKNISSDHPYTVTRLAAIQALYQAEVCQQWNCNIIAQYWKLVCDKSLQNEIKIMHLIDYNFFTNLVEGVIKSLKDIDQLINKTLNNGWTTTRLEIVLCIIIRIGTYEIIAHKETPIAVIINEYMNATHLFFDKKESHMVNAVLDRIAKQLRPEKIKEKKEKLVL